MIDRLKVNALSPSPSLILYCIYTDENRVSPMVLQAMCEGFILDKLDVDNIVPIYLCAQRFVPSFHGNTFKYPPKFYPQYILFYRHCAMSLKSACLDFFVENLEVLRGTPSFQDLKKEPELLMEIIMRGKI
jgi:hypothetical protein